MTESEQFSRNNNRRDNAATIINSIEEKLQAVERMVDEIKSLDKDSGCMRNVDEIMVNRVAVFNYLENKWIYFSLQSLQQEIQALEDLALAQMRELKRGGFKVDKINSTINLLWVFM